MSGLENLNKRLNYRGGNQEGRMQQRKLETLKKALIYSYQAATAKLSDGREFRCLINPDKLKENYDDKIISIPFKDICLNAERVGKTSEGQVEVGMKAGDVFEWKETGTHWLVYLQRLEEDAYFRAEIRRCQYEVQVGEDTYKVYVRGPGGADISWHTKQTGVSWNDLNYDAVMYITRDEKTMEAFQRFDIIEIAGKPWEIQMVDRLTTEGIITINLKEYYQNSIKEEAEEKLQEIEEQKPIEEFLINGDTAVYPYDEKEYSIAAEISGGVWEISNKKAVILKQDEKTMKLAIVWGKSGSFDILYKREGFDDIVLPIEIKSL
jgi:hypothetical protein